MSDYPKLINNYSNDNNNRNKLAILTCLPTTNYRCWKPDTEFKGFVINTPKNSRYSPRIEINTVTWKNGSSPKDLKSVQEILAAQQNGSLTINRNINYPIISKAALEKERSV